MYHRFATLGKTLWMMLKTNPFLLVAWFFTFYFGLAGIQFLILRQFIAGSVLVLAALVVLPPLNSYLEEKHKLRVPRWLKVVLCAALFYVYTVTADLSQIKGF